MKILYDSAGNLAGAYAVPLSQLLPADGAPPTLAIDDLAVNLPLIADLAARMGLTDALGRQKYFVRGGALYVRDGWAVGNPPASTGYRTTDRRVTYYATRRLADILAAVRALSGDQQVAAWKDLSAGNPPKYLSQPSQREGAIFAMDWVLGDSQSQSPAVWGARLRILAMWAQDNPTYLVTPAFDPTINVPGVILV